MDALQGGGGEMEADAKQAFYFWWQSYMNCFFIVTWTKWVGFFVVGGGFFFFNYLKTRYLIEISLRKENTDENYVPSNVL